jgi:hypothetical protein
LRDSIIGALVISLGIDGTLCGAGLPLLDEVLASDDVFAEGKFGFLAVFLVSDMVFSMRGGVLRMLRWRTRCS